MRYSILQQEAQFCKSGNEILQKSFSQNFLPPGESFWISRHLRTCIHNLNAPPGRIFFRHISLNFLAVHKVCLDKYGCKGAPDLVIEILSPSTLRHDRFVKLDLYQQAGVREYWIVEPETQTVQVYTLENGILQPRAFYGQGDVAKVNVLEGCFIELSKVFTEFE